ncbi:hypothetical protein M3Y94_00460800 [Aphelenchoides besseyi]|nr:hypothetical protein M3Y94_00460800 [Aphelenchoides besseyi]
MRHLHIGFLIAWLMVAESSDDCYEYPHRRHKLTLGVLVPENFQHSIGASVELALKHVHATPKLIPDYCIDLLYRNTQCKTSTGIKSMFDLMNAERRPVALFGSMCTTVNEPIAMAAKYWNILQMSYAETHAKFSTADANEVYPTFYRIVPGDQNIISARCHLIRHYNWTRVGTIKQSDKPRYALPHESLTTQLENPYGIRVVYTAGVSSDQLQHIGYQLDELKRRDAHIIVGDLAPEVAIHVLCEAFAREMYGADYVWILPGYHEARWWSDMNESNCTLEEIEQVLQNHLAVEFSPFRPDFGHSIISNHTVSEIKGHMKDGYCTQDGCETNVYGAYAYDGIWSLALALNASLYSEEGPRGDEESAEKTAARLLAFMGHSFFDGVTGTVRFENNERLGLVSLFQWQNGSYTNIGYYDSADHVFDLNSNNNWMPPRDATVVVRQRQYVNYFLLGAMCSIALVGVLLALMFLFINIKYRNHKFIKMSSPNLNNFIIIGSICAYVSIFLLGLDTRFVSAKSFERLCYTKTWVLSVGFTLAFGSMFSKTWRVHSIFTNIRKDKKAIKDAQLFLIVALILLIDGVILGVWAFVSPFRFQVTEHEPIRHKNQLIIPELERCHSHYSIFFQVMFYIIKGMLMIFGCFLAWETRAVNVPALNDSKYIGMSVYNVVVMSVIGVSLAFILQEKINEAFFVDQFLHHILYYINFVFGFRTKGGRVVSYAARYRQSTISQRNDEVDGWEE